MTTLEAAEKVEIRILVDNADRRAVVEPALCRRRDGLARPARPHGLGAMPVLRGAWPLMPGDGSPRRQAAIPSCSIPGPRTMPSNATSRGSASISARSRASCCRTAIGTIPARCCWRSAPSAAATAAARVPFYAHPGMFVTRGVRHAGRCAAADGRRAERSGAFRFRRRDGGDDGAADASSTGCFTSAAKSRALSGFERGFPGQVKRTANGWEPDELLMDERWLAVNVAGKGLVVFSACSHAGIVNVCRHARATFPDMPIHAVMGGLHLVGPERGDHSADGRGAEGVRHQDHRRRPLHRLARHDGAGERVSRCARADRRRQAIHVLIGTPTPVVI